ncbi:MAG: sodium:alanine symporter family protein [Clostridia bacterium]|nr:sodium:alanine symporter family protein [Clostridia bacterium]
MNAFFDFFTGDFCQFLWQGILIPLVLLGGVCFTLQTRGMQLLRAPLILRETLGRLFQKSKSHGDGVSPFQALCTALAGTVGTGSIVGTCQALALGGPGALFWLWVAAFFGMIIKYFEVVLAIRFRVRDEKGEWQGGPMYYILRGMGKPFRPLAILFALFALLSSFGMGCLAQSNSVFAGVRGMAASIRPLSESAEQGLARGVALAIALVLGFSLLGGVKRIGRVAELLVPVISLAFTGGALWVILCHRQRLPWVFCTVIRSAFGKEALLGAGAGIGFKTALEWGLKRSAFSNEAGLGSAAIAHANAETDDPVRQGFLGIFEVFVDTLVICSLTGITILAALPMEHIFSHPSPDATLITDALATVFGGRFSLLFIGGSLALFAFSTLLGWSLYGARCAAFLWGSIGAALYRPLFVICAALGALLAMEPIWAISDVFNALMAIPNFIALFALSRTVCAETKRFFQSMSAHSRSPRKKI